MSCGGVYGILAAREREEGENSCYSVRWSLCCCEEVYGEKTPEHKFKLYYVKRMESGCANE